MKVDAEQFPPLVVNMVEAYFQHEQARQSRALWPEVRSSRVEKGIYILGESINHIHCCFRSTGERLLEYWVEDSLLPNSPINLIKFQHESDDDDVSTIDDLDPAPTKMEDNHLEVYDPLLEINVGTKGESRPLFVSNFLNLKLSVKIIGLLCECKDCFAWDYHGMLGLPRGLLEHKLKIKDRDTPNRNPSMAQIAIGIQMPEDCVQRIIKVGKKSLPSVLTRGMEIDVNSAIITEDDWRNPIINYLQYPTLPFEKRVRIMALNYLMWNGDLVRKTKDEVLLRCLGKKEYIKSWEKLMTESVESPRRKKDVLVNQKIWLLLANYDRRLY
ncbi:hypothetical protein L3X38_045433 [Prunus dulcis]|uniref:Uncharacterized protein n=1 Tax=Prunus dulcis TaxID=3755 RepID=A0AAD4V2A6_PRUDU|nr:hypothetical protein L3X38_045433 [Prunus dulcis]